MKVLVHHIEIFEAPHQDEERRFETPRQDEERRLGEGIGMIRVGWDDHGWLFGWYTFPARVTSDGCHDK